MMKSIKRLASKFDAIDILNFITFRPFDGVILHQFLASESTIERCNTPDDIINLGLELSRLCVVFHGNLIDAVEQNNEEAIEAIIQDALKGDERKIKTTVVDIDV